MNNSARWGNYLGPADTPYHGGKFLQNLLLFGRLCKALGMDVTPNCMMDVAHALEFVDLTKQEDVYHTFRALMVTRQRDLDLFDQAFRIFWQTPVEDWATMELKSPGRRVQRQPPNPTFGSAPSTNKNGQPNSATETITFVPTYSDYETLRTKNFAEMTGEEILAAKRIMERLAWSLGMRQTRRFHPGNGDQLDLRHLFRANMRYAGELIDLPTRVPTFKPRPLVMICDISGSMERYTRLLLHFVHTLSQSIYQVESFVFSTRLSRITRIIRRKAVDRALAEVGLTVKDWGGGTKIGDALHNFNYQWARRVLGRGAVVLLITDGWDRGDPEVLSAEIERLQRNCHRLIWLNPLLGSPDYEPLTRGAQAMLPNVDDFLPVHNLASLENLAKELWQVNWHRPTRVRHAHLINSK
ncbi:MAG: VWA domain-containing protein [Chloroflexi bacterium]|nr:VWA domain-containing protein [Chloroflexota bacterium]